MSFDNRSNVVWLNCDCGCLECRETEESCLSSSITADHNVLPSPFAGWPSRLTSFTSRICHSRKRRWLPTPTQNSWRSTANRPKAARSTASWASAGTSYPSIGATYRQRISPLLVCILTDSPVSCGKHKKHFKGLCFYYWVEHLETSWPGGNFVLTDGKYVRGASSHV